MAVNATNIGTANDAKNLIFKCFLNTVNLSYTDYVNSAKLCVDNIQKNYPIITRQSSIVPGSVSTDIAIEGSSAYIVQDLFNSNITLLTREGSFRINNNGHLANVWGYEIQAFNSSYVNQTPDFLNLGPIDLVNLANPTYNRPTSNIKIIANLDSSQISQGNGETINFPKNSLQNYNIKLADVISPENSGSNILNQGDSITLASTKLGSSYNYAYGGVAISADITAAPILGANSPLAYFSGATDGWSFTISTTNIRPITYNFLSNSPNSTLNQFNNLQNLADIIDQTPGLTARIDNSNQHLLISAIDATGSISLTDKAPGSFVNSLFGSNPVTFNAEINRFSTLEGLSHLINKSNGLGALAQDIDSGYLSFFASNPTDTLTVSSTSSLLTTFGLIAISPKAFGPIYDVSSTTNNMASGYVTANFNIPLNFIDPLGTNHNATMGFLKFDKNNLVSEIYVNNPAEILNGRTDGQLAMGYIVFNGDGSLNSLSSSLTEPITISWSNGAANSVISFDLGIAGIMAGTGTETIGMKNGLRQLNSDYQIDLVKQDGLNTGGVHNFIIDREGNLFTNYTNGATDLIYQIPLATVDVPKALIMYNNNITWQYNQTLCGDLHLTSAYGGLAGVILSGFLELLN